MKFHYILMGLILLWPKVMLANETATTQSAEVKTRQVAKDITDIYLAGMRTIFEYQQVINSASEQKESLFGDAFIGEVKKQYLVIHASDFPSLDRPLIGFLISSMKLVMEENRALIYDDKLTQKGFIPATFAFQLSQQFSNGHYPVSLKYTGFSQVVFNELNIPDAWEAKVLNKMSLPGWPVQQRYLERVEVNGETATRYLSPLFYTPPCMECHGSIQDSPLNRDKPIHQWVNKNRFGFPMPNAKVGELGGGISLILGDRAFIKRPR